jgi:hypothetical protein
VEVTITPEATAGTPSGPVVPVVEDPAVKWRRRLLRWQKKAEDQGVNAKGLMLELAA